MFFYRFFRDNNFKSRKSLSGQVFPFLLICIAALIVGASIAISAGKSAITKTNASNAADACSLAAGSVWASGFNDMVTSNKEMVEYFNLYQDNYTILHELAYGSDGSGGYLGAGDKSAYTFSLRTQTYAQGALNKINAGGSDCSTLAQNRSDALDYYIDAMDSALDSARYFAAVYILAEYMRLLTDNFKVNQAQNYCDMRSVMENSITEAKTSGVYYAFSNSGTSSRAPSGDAFSNWLRRNKYTEDSSFGDSSSDLTYKWQWASEKCGTSEGGTTISFTQPDIEFYKVAHTKKNYPDKTTLSVNQNVQYFTVTATSDGATITTEIVDDIFNIVAASTLATVMVNIRENLLELYSRLYDSCDPSECCPDVTISTCVEDYQTCIVNTNFYDANLDGSTRLLNIVIKALNVINYYSSSTLSVAALKKAGKDIIANVWTEDTGNYFESNSCNDIQGFGDDTEVDSSTEIDMWNALLIVGLGEEPELNPASWEVVCTVTAFYNNIYSKRSDSCGDSSTSSTSTSEFHGEGDIGTADGSNKDDYETEIISAG